MSVNAKRIEIARRYRWQARRRRRKPFSMAAIRVSELDRLFTCRHGTIVPDGRVDLVTIMANHLAMMSGDPRKRILDWIRYRAPWMPIGATHDLLAAAILKPQRYKADALAWKLGLIEIDRATLKIRTIGAVDCSKYQRKRRRKEAKRLERATKRRDEGIEPRPIGEKPWKDAKISRRTWYRRKKMALVALERGQH